MSEKHRCALSYMHRDGADEHEIEISTGLYKSHLLGEASKQMEYGKDYRVRITHDTSRDPNTYRKVTHLEVEFEKA